MKCNKLYSKYMKNIENKSMSQRGQLYNFYRRKFSGAHTNYHPILCCVFEEIFSRDGFRASY